MKIAANHNNQHYYAYKEGLQLEVAGEVSVAGVVVVVVDSVTSAVVSFLVLSSARFELTDEISLLKALSLSLKSGSPSFARRSISFFKLTMSFGLKLCKF